ncbi:hypothetical protein KAR91_46455 [Candidatus Pacearchaeota archaeon]|nr:hypothetical protein [Candidatus Pacearchaeota archaeon]
MNKYTSRTDVPGYDKTPDWDNDESEEENYSHEYLNDEERENYDGL